MACANSLASAQSAPSLNRAISDKNSIPTPRSEPDFESVGQSTKHSAPEPDDDRLNSSINLTRRHLSQTVPLGPDRKVRAYKLEVVEIQGTTRLTAAQISQELGLKKGTPLNDDLVMTTRGRLLSFGLFKSAILLMRKGSKPGWARLVIEVEDDEGVLSDWAVGADLAVQATETNASTTASGASSDRAAMDYRVGLIGRNLFQALHRGSVSIDFDSDGRYREGQLAYGLPRFAVEGVQFDAEIASVDVQHRYLSALGFGGRGQGLWSRSLANAGEIQYGAAMYVNKEPRFAVPGFPKSVAGPKFAFYDETRLHGFFPGEGHLLGASLLFAPMRTEHSVLELNFAKTLSLKNYVYLTVDARALTVGAEGYAFRGEGRVDVPLGHAVPGQDQAEVFLRLRGGQDAVDNNQLTGSAAILGVRYHSSGFIAELSVKVTKTPEEFASDIPKLGEEP